METAEILAQARGILLGDAAAGAKVECLRRLIAGGHGRALRGLLTEAATSPANASILKDLVRAYGYTGDRAAIADLAPHCAHADKSVVCNALKAAIALDAGNAVRLGMQVVKSARPQVALPAALLLARQCEPACRDFFLGLSYAPRERDRLAALVYLRSRPPEESVPVVLDMVRRERDADLRAHQNKLLARRIPKRDAGVLRDLRLELVGRIAEIDELIGRLPAELEPTWTGNPQELRAKLQESVPALPRPAEPPPPPAVVAPAPGPAAVAEPPPPSRRAALAVAAGVALAALAGVAALGARDAAPARPVEKLASALGNPGSRVEVRGTLDSVDRATKTLTLSKGRWVVIVKLLDADAGALAVGKPTTVDGILTEIRPGDTYLVQGLSATQ